MVVMVGLVLLGLMVVQVVLVVRVGCSPGGNMVMVVLQWASNVAGVGGVGGAGGDTRF